jgi:hypothetical protein
MEDDVRELQTVSSNSSSDLDEDEMSKYLAPPPPAPLLDPHKRRKSLDLIDLKRRLITVLG